MAHGLIVWFDAELIDGIGFSNAPESKIPAKVYGSAFFPFLRPVAVSEKDQEQIEISAILVNDEYTWGWNTHIVSDENIAKGNLNNQPFTELFSLWKTLRKRQPGYIPKLNSKGLIEQFIQQEMNGMNSLRTIAEKLLIVFLISFLRCRKQLKEQATLPRNTVADKIKTQVSR